MNRAPGHTDAILFSVPRRRGDEPAKAKAKAKTKTRSPQARG